MASNINEGPQDWDQPTQKALQLDVDYINSHRAELGWNQERDFRHNVQLVAWEVASNSEREQLENLWRSQAFTKFSQLEATADLFNHLSRDKNGKWAIDINSRRILPLAVFMLKQQLLLTEHERAFHNAIHRVDKELAQQWDRVRRYEQHSIADDQWLKELAIGITTNMEAILKEMRWTETIKKPFETQSRQLLVQPMYKKLRAAQQTYENVEEGYWAVHQLCQSLDAQDEPKPEDLNQLDRPSSLCALWRGVHLKSMPLSAMTPAKLVPNATALICQP